MEHRVGALPGKAEAATSEDTPENDSPPFPSSGFRFGRGEEVHRCPLPDSRVFAFRPGSVPPSLASRKSTCFLKVSTFATCTRTSSPSRITRRVRRPIKLAALDIEHVEIVLQRWRDGTSPLIARPGHIHEEAEVAHVGDQRRICRRLGRTAAARSGTQTSSRPCCRARRRRNCVQCRRCVPPFP